MKKKGQCPVCGTPLEIRDVAPCIECGAEPRELEECRTGHHTYAEYEVFPGVAAVLCNFCDGDFGSYDPTIFGLPKGAKIGFDRMHFIRGVRPEIGKDKYCPTCQHRLAFLTFKETAKEKNEANNRPNRTVAPRGRGSTSG